MSAHTAAQTRQVKWQKQLPAIQGLLVDQFKLCSVWSDLIWKVSFILCAASVARAGLVAARLCSSAGPPHSSSTSCSHSAASCHCRTCVRYARPSHCLPATCLFSFEFFSVTAISGAKLCRTRVLCGSEKLRSVILLLGLGSGNFWTKLSVSLQNRFCIFCWLILMDNHHCIVGPRRSTSDVVRF